MAEYFSIPLLGIIYPHMCIQTLVTNLGGWHSNVGLISGNLSENKIKILELKGKVTLPCLNVRHQSKAMQNCLKKMEDHLIQHGT